MHNRHDKIWIPLARRPSWAFLAVSVPIFLTGCAPLSSTTTAGPQPSQLVVQTSDSTGQRREATTRPVPVSYRETAVRDTSSAPTASRTPSESTPAQSAGPDAGARTMLSFVNADLPGVVRALSRFTGRNFVVDPRVQGQMTLVSEAPVDADTAYTMLLSALRMQGFAVVEVDGVSRVLPEADAKLQGMPVVGPDTSARQGELATRVFQLRYENAANLVPILRPMIAPNNTINAYAANNTLVVTDYADNLDRIAQVIAGIDTPDAFSTDVIPVRYGVALDVAALAAQMLNSGNQATSRTVVLADPRSNSVLLRASSPDKLDLARRLVRRIDSPQTRDGNLNVVYLRNAQATQLAEVLRGALTGLQNSQQPSAGLESRMQQAVDQTDALLPGNDLSSMSQLSASPFSGNTGAGQAFGDPLNPNAQQPMQSTTATTSFSAGGATVQADPATNTLIISAPPPLYRSLREVIDQLDQRRAQVLVESLIVEVNAETAAEFGIQWMAGGDNLSGSNGSAFIGGANFGGTGINTAGISTIDALGQGLSLGVVRGTVNVLGNEILNLGILARAMQSAGGVNVLSTPNLMTLDNEEASIMVGRTVPFVTGRYTTSADGASNPFQTITREDIGLTLRLRPQISEGGTVKLALYQEVSSIDTAASTPSTGIITRKRALETDVLVDDGQIIVLGGLLEDMITDGSDSVPFLGDLPGIGNLFRYDTRRRSKTNLMIFLRPHIVRDARDSASVTLDRYNYMRAAQSQLPARATWFAPDEDMTPLPAVGRNPESGLLDLRNTGQVPTGGTPASFAPPVPPQTPEAGTMP